MKTLSASFAPQPSKQATEENVIDPVRAPLAYTRTIFSFGCLRGNHYFNLRV